jgi:CheY-like chemotaxis protein
MKLSLAMSAANRAAEVGALMLAYLGQTSTRRSPLDLSEAFSQCLDDICADMPPNINVEQALPAFALAVSANSGQLKQILSNLITNAREAIAEQQGTISIFFKSVSPQKISDVNRFPGNFQPEARDYACVEVKDTGCGIAKADIAKLFDPFYSTRFTGRGLGLAVVLGHVKSHNGCITLESRPGHGSIFRVYMPLSDKPAPLKDIQSQKLKTKAKVGKILVVDDEPMIREMTAASIKSIGLEVIEASDGVEAIELFQRHRDKIICVLCDLTMPRMDGWGTLKILREIAPEIPVILASGYNEAMVMGDRHSALPRAFLQKPYSLRDLRNTIQQAIAAASEE